jgi:hypothetical protein
MACHRIPLRLFPHSGALLIHMLELTFACFTSLMAHDTCGNSPTHLAINANSSV